MLKSMVLRVMPLAFTKMTWHRVTGKPNHFIKTLREGILNFETGIGSWRVSTTRINYPTEKYKFKYNKLIQIPLQENESLDVVDEWDWNDMKKRYVSKSFQTVRASSVLNTPEVGNHS